MNQPTASRNVAVFRAILFCLLVFCLQGCNQAPEPTRTQSATTLPHTPSVSEANTPTGPITRVLFLGNSHMQFGNVPRLVQQTMQATAESGTVVCESRIQGFLEHFNLDKALKAKIENGDWDLLVLQGQKISSSGKYSFPIEPAIELCELANKSATRVILFCEWGRLNVEGETQRIEKVYQSIAEPTGAELSPVGEAWQLALEQRPEVSFHAGDGNHSNPTGALLAATVLYASITGKNPEDLPVDSKSRIDEATQKRLRQVAHATVKARTRPEKPVSKTDEVVSDSAEKPNSWYRGNLHTHSLWSDGDDFPEMITKWYVDHGYNFLAMTDHNILARGDRWMDQQKIVDRGGETAIEKYQEAFGGSLFQTREAESGTQVRLTPLAEYRSQFETEGKFLLLEGEEVSDSVDQLPVHLNAVNLEQLLQPAGGKTVREAIDNNFRMLQEQSQAIGRRMFMQLNHPNFGWAITAEELASVRRATHFEVYNGHPAVNHTGSEQRVSVERMWDIANTLRLDKLKYPPLLGLATDDSHYYHGRPGSHTGRGWIMVRASELTADALMTAIARGDFYSSSGVTLSAIVFDAETRELKIDIHGQEGVDYETRFIGTRQGYDEASTPVLDEQGDPLPTTQTYSSDVGQELARDTSLSPSYKFQGDEIYVRAVITSSRSHPDPSFEGQVEQAWTQPFGWQQNEE